MTHEVSHTERVVFVGIDVHRRTYKVHVFDGETEWNWSCTAITDVLIATLNKRFPGRMITTVYEAGFSGFGLHRALEGAGFKSCVVNPAAVLADRSCRSKTDAKDARNMALQLRTGLLDDRMVQVPSKEEELGRVAQRTRIGLKSQCVSIKNTIRMRLHVFNCFPLEHTGVLTLSQATEMVAELPDKELQIALSSLLSVWKCIEAEISALNAVIREQAAKDALDPIYRSVPGVGTLTARVLSSELGDMSRFSSGKKVASYVGLVCSERSSGESRKLGRISKRGKPHLRFILIQAAWGAVRRSTEFKELYKRLAHRMGAKKAIVAVARRMLVMLRALLKQRVHFSAELLRATLGEVTPA